MCPAQNRYSENINGSGDEDGGHDASDGGGDVADK